MHLYKVFYGFMLLITTDGLSYEDMNVTRSSVGLLKWNSWWMKPILFFISVAFFPSAISFTHKHSFGRHSWVSETWGSVICTVAESPCLD